MKNRYFRFLLATVVLWCTMASVQAQSNYFRVINGIPHLPVVANTAAVATPLPGALVYSVADLTVRLYTGTGWDNLCGTSLTGVANTTKYFRVVEGISCLPVQVALTGTAPSGAVAYQPGFGLKVNNGTAWKYVADINLQTNIPLNSATAMGNITGATGGFTIPVLTTAPTGITDGAIYIDATTGSAKIYRASVWYTLSDCNCPPQADAVSLQTVDGMTFYSGFAYYDKEGDPEGVSVVNWYKSVDASGSGRSIYSTGYTHTEFTNTEEYYLSFTVTPVSTAGALTGTPVTSDYYLVKNCPPQAKGVLVETADNKTFGASYTYYDKEGNAEGATTIDWYTAADALGTGSTQRGTGSSFTVPPFYDYNYVSFSVTPKAIAGVSSGTATASPWYHIANCEPQVTGISINGTLASGNTLKAGYIYYDKDEDAESGTTFQWYRAVDAIGSGKTVISGATGRSYTLTASDVGKYIGVAVIPMAQAGYLPANAYFSLNFLKVN